MKSMLPPVLATLLALTVTALALPAQAIFSRFDFNGTPLTTATIGPNGTSTDPDAVIDGTAAYVMANCSGTKGIDLLIPSPGGLFDRSSMGMAFRFRREEARADFFERGGTHFYVTDAVLHLAYRTTDGAGGTLDYGPINTGYTLPADSAFHEYIFVYEHLGGIATVTVDGAPVYTFDGPDNRPFDWTAAPDPIVGTVMDGNCPGTGVLDYAYFFDPEVPLSAASIVLQASADEGDVQLDWEASFTSGPGHVSVERSRDGQNFVAIAKLDLATNPLSQHRDVQPGGGEWFYRITHQDASGALSHSETRRVALAAATALQVWPNPTAGELDIQVPDGLVGQPLTLLNLQGQAVLTRTATEGRMAWNLAGLAPGYYLLQGEAGGQVYRQRVLLR